jgi:DNA-binding beta-propeller fold protein YncE
MLTGEGDGAASFSKPTAVAAGRGRVYVSDAEGRQVFVFDLARRRVFAFGRRLEGQLRRPAGIALGPDGRVWVVDGAARSVLIYDDLGLYLGRIDGAGAWSRPTAVAVAPASRRVYVLDTGGVDNDSHRVHVYDAEGRPQGTLGRRGGAPGEFNLPTDIDVGADGTLWVLDSGNFRVQAFDPEGVPLRAFGAVGNGLGQLARPRGLTVDRDGLVYVSDATFCNVQVFTPDGSLLLAIGTRGERDAPGRFLLPAKLAADETGRLYIIDQYFHKVEVVRRLDDAEGRRLQAQSA